MWISFAVFAFFGIRRAIVHIKILENAAIEYSFYLAALAVLVLILRRAYQKMREAHATAAVILTNVDPSRNLERCTTILNSMLLSLVLVLCATMFPFAIFLMNWGGMANITPFAMLILAFYFMRKTALLIDGNHSYAPTLKPGIMFAKL